jgi:hypothetical protein
MLVIQIPLACPYQLELGTELGVKEAWPGSSAAKVALIRIS